MKTLATLALILALAACNSPAEQPSGGGDDCGSGPDAEFCAE